MEYTKDMSKITEKQIRREAARYKSRAAFILGSPEEFSSALESGTLDEYCAHMVGGRRALKWTPETIAAEASKYRTRYDFKKDSSGAYEAAGRLKIRNDVCAHMTRKVRATKWTPEKIAAKEKLKRLSIKQTFWWGGERLNAAKWTPETIAAEASKYRTRSEFNKGSGSAYGAAGTLGIRDEVCAHMVRRVWPTKWTPETIAVEASKYRTRPEFNKGSGGAYAAAIRLGIRDDVCAHMVPVLRWTPETIAAEASKYRTRSEFDKGSGGAYEVAGKLGIRDEVCAHMVRKVGATK